MSKIAQRLQEKNITLPKASTPVANYVSATTVDNLMYISGQICMQDGKLVYKGKLGKDLSKENGYNAARLCGLNLLSQLDLACLGDLDKVLQCVQLSIFVNSTPDFIDQPFVANGASDLMVEVFEEKGKHSRAAVSSVSLPLGTAVEVAAIFQVE